MYLSPASIKRTRRLGSSLRREARTQPAVPKNGPSYPGYHRNCLIIPPPTMTTSYSSKFPSVSTSPTTFPIFRGFLWNAFRFGRPLAMTRSTSASKVTAAPSLTRQPIRVCPPVWSMTRRVRDDRKSAPERGMDDFSDMVDTEGGVTAG